MGVVGGQALIIAAFFAATTVNAPPPEGWRCRNTVEVQCHDNNCTALPQDETTPLDVAFTTTGAFIVCAYTGCWEGDGKIAATDPFLVITQKEAPWSDPFNPENAQDILITYHRADNIAVVKAGGFVIPLACEVLPPRVSLLH